MEQSELLRSLFHLIFSKVAPGAPGEPPPEPVRELLVKVRSAAASPDALNSVLRRYQAATGTESRHPNAAAAFNARLDDWGRRRVGFAGRFEEQKHPRGKPKNPGQFAPKGQGGQAQKTADGHGKAGTRPRLPSGMMDVAKVIERHGGDQTKAFDHIRSAISKHMAAGGQVSAWMDGKEYPIAKLENGKLIDHKGQSWGLMPLAMGTPGTKSGVEFKPGTGQQPTQSQRPTPQPKPQQPVPSQPRQPTPPQPGQPTPQQPPSLPPHVSDARLAITIAASANGPEIVRHVVTHTLNKLSHKDVRDLAHSFGIQNADQWNQDQLTAVLTYAAGQHATPTVHPTPDQPTTVHPVQSGQPGGQPPIPTVHPTPDQPTTVHPAPGQPGSQPAGGQSPTVHPVQPGQPGGQPPIPTVDPVQKKKKARQKRAKKRLGRLMKALRPMVKKAVKVLKKFAKGALKAAAASATGKKVSKRGIGRIARITGIAMGYAGRVLPGAKLASLSYLWASNSQNPEATLKRSWAMIKKTVGTKGIKKRVKFNLGAEMSRRNKKSRQLRRYASFADDFAGAQSGPLKALAARVAEHERNGSLDWYSALVMTALDQAHGDLESAIAAADDAFKADPHGGDQADMQPATFAAQHAPKGGVTIKGNHYVGGQFIPAEVLAQATPEERAAVEGKGGAPANTAHPDPAVAADLKRIDEAGLNEWPKKTELATKLLGDHPDTQSLYSTPNPEGGRTYTAPRKALHDQIVESILSQGKPPADGVKRCLFMAGGTASGKSSALRASPELIPEGAVTIDPDGIKGMLPEYQQMSAVKDKYSASAAHEESSDIAKRVTAEAMRRGLPVVVDGTGDSKPGKFAGKFRDMHDAGYEVSLLCVTIPTEKAIPRAIDRAKHEGRWVPVPEIRNQHKNVSANHPEVAALPFLKNMAVYSNDVPKGQPPVLLATGGGGKVNVHDEAGYRSFLDKSGEGTQDVAGHQRASS